MRLVLRPLAQLVVLGLIVCLSGEAAAQEAGRVYRLGHISMMTPEGMAPYLATLEDALRDLGYVKGRNLVIENRSANGDAAKLGAAASDLVRLNVDVIVTGTSQGVVAVRQVTTTVPIVMVYAVDPVGAGIIQSLARPGGNVTGGTFEPAPDIYAKMGDSQGDGPEARARRVLMEPQLPRGAQHRGRDEEGGRSPWRALSIRRSANARRDRGGIQRDLPGTRGRRHRRR